PAHQPHLPSFPTRRSSDLKTIESCLIAKELMERGEANGLTVLCSPALAEQWQAELRDKFAIEATLVLPSTATRLERDLRLDETIDRKSTRLNSSHVKISYA